MIAQSLLAAYLPQSYYARMVYDRGHVFPLQIMTLGTSLFWSYCAILSAELGNPDSYKLFTCRTR